MYKIGEEKMVICPYNRYHIVSTLRIQKHIIKCKKNYPDVKLATCFYNYCHRLNPENMLAHYGVCSHKTRVENCRYEPDDYSSNNRDQLEKDDQGSVKFPDINVKPQFFCDDFASSSCSSSEVSCEDIDVLNFSDSDSESDTFKIEFSDDGEVNDDDDNNDDNDDDDDDDDLEPLPLPKTVSKAFVCAKQRPNTPLSATSINISQFKGFGRAKNFLACSTLQSSRTTEHLLPDLKSFECSPPKKGKSTRLFSSYVPSSSESIVSSMFDDTSTFKSEEVIYDKNDSDENNINGFILKNFDKYTKL